MVGRVVEQGVRICDLSKALLGVGRDQQGGAALAGGAVHGHVADDQLVVVDAHAADAGGDALLIGSTVVSQVVQAGVHDLALVGLRVYLPHAGQAAVCAHDAAAEVQLAVVLHRIAEQRCIVVERLCHQQPSLAGLGVDLDQHAIGTAAVLLVVGKESAIEHGIKGGLQHFFIILVAQGALHQRQGVAHGRIAGTHIQPIAVPHSGPGVVLAPVAGIVALGLRVGHHVHCAIAQIVHDAVCDLDVLFRVRELFKRIAVFVVVEGVAVLQGLNRGQIFPGIDLCSSLCTLCRSQKLHRQSGQHSRCQHTADHTFPVHNILLFMPLQFLHTYYEEIVKKPPQYSTQFPRAQGCFSTKDRFFRKNLGKSAKKPPGSGESGGKNQGQNRFTRGWRSRCRGPRSSWQTRPS